MAFFTWVFMLEFIVNNNNIIFNNNVNTELFMENTAFSPRLFPAFCS